MTEVDQSSLHLVFSGTGFAACLLRRTEAEAIVLLGDGVYSVQSTLPGARLYAIADDLALRGLESSRLPEQVQAISYSELVDLAAGSSKTVSWR